MGFSTRIHLPTLRDLHRPPPVLEAWLTAFADFVGRLISALGQFFSGLFGGTVAEGGSTSAGLNAPALSAHRCHRSRFAHHRRFPLARGTATDTAARRVRLFDLGRG